MWMDGLKHGLVSEVQSKTTPLPLMPPVVLEKGQSLVIPNLKDERAFSGRNSLPIAYESDRVEPYKKFIIRNIWSVPIVLKNMRLCTGMKGGSDLKLPEYPIQVNQQITVILDPNCKLNSEEETSKSTLIWDDWQSSESIITSDETMRPITLLLADSIGQRRIIGVISRCLTKSCGMMKETRMVVCGLFRNCLGERIYHQCGAFVDCYLSQSISIMIGDPIYLEYPEQKLNIRGHTDRIYSVKITLDGYYAFTASDDRTIQKWCLRQNVRVAAFEAHTSSVRCLDLSKDGTLMISGGEDHILKIWDVYSLGCLNVYYGHSDIIRQVCFIHNGTDQYSFISGSEDHSIRLWKIDPMSMIEQHSDTINNNNHYHQKMDHKCVAVFKGHSDWIRSLIITNDDDQNSHILSGSLDCTLVRWISQRKRKKPPSSLIYEGRVIMRYSNGEKGPNYMALNPDHSLLAVCISSGLCIYEYPSMNLVKCMDVNPQCVCFHPLCDDNDDSIVAVGCFQSVKLYGVSSGECIMSLDGHTSVICDLCFTPNGNRLLSCSWDRTLSIWNVEGLKDIVRQLRDPTFIAHLL